MASNTTLFVNKTRDMVKMKVGNSQYSSDLASIEGGGGEYRMHVNMNDTYREFMVGIGSEGKRVIVTSDDCCDFQCITIKEVNGQIDLLREPRQQATSSANTAAKRPWFTWKMWV